MTPILSNLTRKHTCWLIIVFIFSSLHVAAQKELSGNLNQPFAKVTWIEAGPADDEFDVDNVTGFAIGDTILIIQMQGVGIYWQLLPSPLYGTYQTSFGEPGAHEFLIIEDITGNRVRVSNNLIKNYYVNGNVQIVRVPYYNHAVVEDKLFTDPWNPVTGKGGVFALIIGRSLRLDNDIDLTGLGLKGAPITPGDGDNRISSNTNDPMYPTSFTNAGYKGEGIAIHDHLEVLLLTLDYVKGEGPNFTGGGGGNGRFSGGGGGSNRGDGGIGGYEDFVPGQPGGSGGIKIGDLTSPSLADGRIFMGGGGGGSTSNSGAGGNGGGIVIIVTDTIIGNGGRILVNGGKGGDAVPGGGAGGGGAAGTIAISLTSFGPAGNTLILQAKGGDGGDNPAAFGEGGGGGGGLIYVSIPTTPNVDSELTGGAAGSPVNGADDGTSGEKKEDFEVVLNGFLFNSIRSSITGNQVDSICSDTDPPKLTGTTPIGGTGTYTFEWQKDDNETFSSPETVAATQDYDPPTPESSTVWYRRIVTDGVLTDISKSIKMIVQPFIKNNTIGADQIICYNQDPAALVSTGVLADGNGHYAFKWESSPDNGTFGLAPGASISEGYDPSALIADTWYRRTVTSGRCVDISASVNIEVLPDISNNTIISTPQDICFGTNFNNLIGSKIAATTPILGGGDGSYTFMWESKINGAAVWSAAPGDYISPDYDPQELPENAPLNEYYFRRVVKSGGLGGDVCESVSNTVLVRDYPQITNNTISGDQTICSGVVPAEVQGSDPANGDGTYTYTWQSSTKANGWTWTDIPGFINSDSASFQALALADTVLYRRIVMSSACTDISSSVTINVHKPVTNFGINTLSLSSDTTICNGQNPNIIKGGISAGGTNLPASFVYQWYMSADNASFDPVSSGGTSVDYDPPSLTQTTYYRRESVSGACSVNSNVVTVSVLPLISNNTITSDQVICFNTAPAVLTGPALSGGSGIYSYTWEESTDGGNTWIQASGNYNDPTGDYAPPALTIPIKYRRQVKSGLAGCCTNTSQVIDITLHPALPTARIVNADTTIYSGTPVEVMLDLTGSGPWDVTLNENSVPGAATRVDNNRSVVTVYPQAGSDLYTYVLSAVEDKNGCIATDIAGQLIAHIFGGPEVPEGFSPNGDGINDLLMVKGVNPDPGYQLVDLRILTSSGSEVFHTTNYAGQEWQEWDGNDLSGKPLPEGTYYYLLKVNTVLNNISYKESGFIILKRY